jgi:2-polyprenyl-6-methoxyphenol hydroxylase-like FAD-dependent oxidoreductase
MLDDRWDRRNHHSEYENMTLQDKKIAIIGGGPGGLTLARLLQLKDAEVKVYERDINPTIRLQGGALDLHDDSGLAALRKAGLFEAFKTNYRPGADKMRIVDNKAAIYYDQHGEVREEAFGNKHFRPEIDRGPLRDILLNSLEPGTVFWDSHVLSLEPIGNSWKMVFQNGDTIVADIVIGADGANSKIRPYITTVKPVWSGITMVEGSIKDSGKTAPRIHNLLMGGKIFAFGNNKTLIVSSKGDGSLGFATGCKTTEFWFRDSGIDFKDHEQVLLWFKKEYSEWGDIWFELFENEETIFIPRPQYCMPLDQGWEPKSNITIIGDAAHWMPPYAGEGVNMAMLDALELSECLTNPGFADVKTAIAYYEKQMCARFAKVGQFTLFNTRWMHQPDALGNMLAMFSNNMLKSGGFMAKSWMNTTLIPAIRKAVGLEPAKYSI